MRCDDHRQMAEEDEERIRKGYMIAHQNRSFLPRSRFPLDTDPLKPAGKQLDSRAEPDRHE
jgi:hypothetical protein